MNRSAMRLADLKGRQPNQSRMLNAKIPVETINAISALATELGANKTEVFVALLNEGLELAARRLQA